MSIYDKKRKKPKLTSLEVGALLASEGATDDVEIANAMADGKMLDPDALERAFYRREFGFDFQTYADDKHRKWVAKDNELDITVTGKMSSKSDPQEAADDDAQTLARMVMKLKRQHDKAKEQTDD